MRNKTQELLSPSLIKKIKNTYSKYRLLYNNYKENKKTPRLQGKKKIKFSFKDKIKKSSFNLSYFAQIPKYLIDKIKNLLFKKSKSINYEKEAANKKLTSKETHSEKKKFNFQIFKTLKDKIIHRKKIMLILIILLIAIIIVIIISTKKMHENKERTAQLDQYKTQIEKIDDELLKAETNAIHMSAERSQIHINNASDLINNLSSFQNVISFEEINTKTNEYNNKIQEIDYKNKKITFIADAQNIINLDSASYKTLSKYENNIYIFGENIGKFNLESKTIEYIENSLNTIIDAADFEKDNNSVILRTSDNALHRLDTKTNKITDLEIEFSSNNIADIKTFNSFLYSLDIGNKQINKYKKQNGSFGAKTEWIKSANIDLTSAKDLFIDGSIYILYSSGQITHLQAGELMPYSLKVENVNPIITNALSFKMHKENKSVFILEPEQKRIISFTSDGDYIKQYLFNSDIEINDFCIIESSQTLLLLSGDKLLQIAI